MVTTRAEKINRIATLSYIGVSIAVRSLQLSSGNGWSVPKLKFLLTFMEVLLPSM